MAEFRGSKNVILQPEGSDRAVVAGVYDHATREYVYTLGKSDASKYRKALVAEGLREVNPPTSESAAKAESND